MGKNVYLEIPSIQVGILKTVWHPVSTTELLITKALLWISNIWDILAFPLPFIYKTIRNT
jgi:hypothetical protein